MSSLFPQKNFLALKIRTKRLVLRPYRVGDETQFLDIIMSEKERLRGVQEDWVLSISTISEVRGVIKALNRGWLLRTIFTFGVWDRETDELIGERKLFRMDWEKGVLETGGFIRKEYEGKFIQDEAALSSVYFAFKGLNMNEVLTSCNKNNVVSRFKIERYGYDMDGAVDDILYYSMKKENFQIDLKHYQIKITYE
jgi:RimJ/RimL family protein N-acetyltransferase